MSSRAQHDFSRPAKGKGKKKPAVLGTNVFIERDYEHGMATRFEAEFPAVLALRGVDEQRFTQTVETINEYFSTAEQVTCGTFIEGLMGFLSCYSIYLCTQPKSYSVYRQMKDFIDHENQAYYRGKGLEFIDPISNGLTGLEIKVLPEPT